MKNYIEAIQLVRPFTQTMHTKAHRNSLLLKKDSSCNEKIDIHAVLNRLDYFQGCEYYFVTTLSFIRNQILETIPISDEVSELVQKLGNFYSEVDGEEVEENAVVSRPFTRPFADHKGNLSYKD